MQQANWTQEVLTGTNSDKIPGSALASPLTLPGALSVPGTISCNVNGTVPGAGGFGLVVSTNKSAGGGEIDFYNVFNGNTGFEFWAADGGGTLRQLLAVANTGKLTGLGFFTSGIASLGAGGSVLTAHGLGARPRIFCGVYGTVNADANLTTGITPGVNPTTNVAFYGIDATNVGVTNGSVATIYFRIAAIL